MNRWLRIAVALLALLGGEGVHAIVHRDDWSRHAITRGTSGVAEAHAGDCRHRQDVHERHHACSFCRGGHSHHLLAPRIAALRTAPEVSFRIDARAAGRAPSLPASGTLGARGPPLTAA